jgi:predicted tellurium resistance membrane protein TerC
MSTKKISTPEVKKDAQNNKMVFEKLNYVLLGASLIVLVIGFAMMSGTTDIYNSTKVTVAPIIVMLGFTLGIVAIFYKGKSKSGE